MTQHSEPRSEPRNNPGSEPRNDPGSEPLPRHDLVHADGRRLFVYGDRTPGELPDSGPPGEPPELHLRRDELTGRWVAISPARNTRPQSRATSTTPSPPCPLCPGGPELPFDYDAAVFENRFPTLMHAPPSAPTLDGPTAPSRGTCEVVLYTSTHTGSLATLTQRELARVIAIWADRAQALWSDPTHRFVMPFENRGEGVGATLSHPHGQIYALDHLPAFAAPRVEALSRHRREQGTCLTCHVTRADDRSAERTLAANGSFTVAVPFAPDWPYEIHVRTRRHGARRIADLTATERRDLAAALREVVLRYDRLFDEPLPYMMTLMEAPADAAGAAVDDWHFSVEFRPPNRGPDKLKMRASVETVAGLFINDTVPEQSAAELAGVELPDGPVDPGGFPDVEVAVP